MHDTPLPADAPGPWAHALDLVALPWLPAVDSYPCLLPGLPTWPLPVRTMQLCKAHGEMQWQGQGRRSPATHAFWRLKRAPGARGNRQCAAPERALRCESARGARLCAGPLQP